MERHTDKKDLIALDDLNGQILVDQITGQIYMAGAAVRLNVPTLVVRHGQTDGNVRHVLQGQVDGSENQLNRNGRETAELAAKKIVQELNTQIGDTKIQDLAESDRLIILTSPISRAKQTAEYFLRHFQSTTGIELQMQEEKSLKEMSFGKYDGLVLEEIDDPVYADLVRKYRQTQDATIDWLGTGESFIDAVVRARNLLERFNRKHAGKLLVLFTHGTFISALRTALGDAALVSDTGRVLFRDRILEHASPLWLAESSSLLADLKGAARLRQT